MSQPPSLVKYLINMKIYLQDKFLFHFTSEKYKGKQTLFTLCICTWAANRETQFSPMSHHQTCQDQRLSTRYAIFPDMRSSFLWSGLGTEIWLMKFAWIFSRLSLTASTVSLVDLLEKKLTFINHYFDDVGQSAISDNRLSDNDVGL